MKYEVVKFINNNLELEVNMSPDEDTIWLTKEQISELFDRDRTVVSRHIKNLFADGELDEKQVSAKNAHTASDGKTYLVDFYNLDVVIAVGSRTRSTILPVFYQWVRQVLNSIKNNNKSNLIRFENDNISLDVTISPQDETVFLNKEQLAVLFDTTRQNIEYHIKNIYDSGELEYRATCKEILQVRFEGDREVERLNTYYNLDMIISIGYRTNTRRGIAFRRWANSILKEYLIKGYVINENRTLVTNENYINLINKVEKMDNRLEKLENESLFFPKRIVVFEDKVFDAVAVISDIISKANNKIVLIDPYTDTKTLNVLKDKKDGVSIVLVTSSKTKITQMNIDSFNSQYGGLSIIINDSYHDRYLIVDDLIFYHLGTSLNYLGNKFAQIDKIEDDDLKCFLRKRIDE